MAPNLIAVFSTARRLQYKPRCSLVDGGLREGPARRDCSGGRAWNWPQPLLSLQRLTNETRVGPLAASPPLALIPSISVNADSPLDNGSPAYCCWPVMAHVVMCRFLRLGCSEDEHPLFRREYARSNREKGVKLLRCFPHCCPEHVKRSYCGCSVHLLLTFSADVRGVALDDVVVATRFEPSQVAPLWPASLVGLFRDAGAAGDDDSARHDNERKLGVGESVQLPASLLALNAGPSSKKGAVWVRAERESEAMQSRFPKNTLLYAVNKRRFPKWFYNYDSSTTRTQREMTHHLVAYVFQQNMPVQSANQANQNEVDHPTAVVLARHASPAFRLISFRRSGTTSNDPCCELPALDTPAVNEASRLSGMSAQQYFQHQSQSNDSTQQYATAGHQQNHLIAHHRDVYSAESYSSDDDLDVGQHSAGGDGPDQWQQREFREKGQDLLILWKFLQCISLHGIGISADTVGSYLLRASATASEAERERVAISFLDGISDRSRGHRDQSPLPIFGSTTPATPFPAPERQIIRITACLFLRGLFSSTAKGILCTASQVGSDATSKARIHGQFTILVSRLYDALDDMLSEYANELSPGNQMASLPALIEAILVLVYGQDQYESIRPEISTLLDSQQSPELLINALDGLFQAYTAQVREFMIASAAQLHGASLDQHTESRDDSSTVLHSGFSRRWTLNPQSVVVCDVALDWAKDVRQDFRLVDAAQIIYEAGCVDIELDTTTPSLSIQSAFSLANGVTKTPTTLFLDGRLRVFRVLPSGLSSMVETAGGWSIGDYAGSLSADGQSLSLDFFAFAEGYHPHSGVEITVVRRVNLTLTLTLGDDITAGDPMRVGCNSRITALIVHGRVYGSALRSSSPGLRSVDRVSTHKLSTSSSSDRAAVWSEQRWMPLMEMQADYAGFPRTRG